MSQVIPWIIAFLGLVSGFVFNLISAARVRKGEIRSEANIVFELESLGKQFAEMKAELKAELITMNRVVMDDHDKIVRHDEQLVTIWKRIDALNERT